MCLWLVVEWVFGLGVMCVVIGMCVVESEDFVVELVKIFGEWIVVGIDVKNG